jgi:signal transduction histidine kinase
MDLGYRAFVPFRRRRAQRLVLWLGFGGLLICIVAAGTGTLLSLERVRKDETAIRRGFLGRMDALDQIRSQMYLSGTYVRDFLLSPDPSGAAAQTSRMESLERQTYAALDAYSGLVEPREREPFAELRSEIDAYWRVLDGMLTWTPEERDRRRESFFYNELIPRRNAMLQIADRIAIANQRALEGAERQLAASSDGLRKTLMATFGITLGGGLLLALLTIGHTLRLERELERRLEENSRARADLEDLSARLLRAQEDERRTLARELHDEVGQTLSAILMEAENAACAADSGEAREHLEAVRGLAEKSVNEVRDLALLLRPSMLDDFGLVPALNWHARETGKRTGLNVVLDADEAADDLPDEHKTCIYRLVQEAVHNSARHANANNIAVELRREAGRVRVTISDDGNGFDPRLARGLGLLGMEERVRRLRGRLAIDSKPGRGASVTALLPLDDPQDNERNAHSHTAG